jgi:hypothetical protein
VSDDERTLPPDQRLQYDVGQRYSEMNTILRRIRKRRSGEPTAQEKARLATLREEIHALRRTGGE